MTSGSSALPAYDATEFVRKSQVDGQPIIAVSIQYRYALAVLSARILQRQAHRLNILGFLAVPDLLEVDGFCGNYGASRSTLSAEEDMRRVHRLLRQPLRPRMGPAQHCQLWRRPDSRHRIR